MPYLFEPLAVVNVVNRRVDNNGYIDEDYDYDLFITVWKNYRPTANGP